MRKKSDKLTDKALIEMEKEVSAIYTKAYEEMNETAKDYFSRFHERYWREHEKYQNGQYTDAEFHAWYRTQIARGDEWKAKRDALAHRMESTNDIASIYINDKTPGIYALNYNYSAYEIEHNTGVYMPMYDETTVRNLARGDNHTEFKVLRHNKRRDYEWNKKQIDRALTAGIIQGKSIDDIADSFLDVMKRNRTAAIRNARTAVTSAQNGGRVESYRVAEENGIKLKKEWLATLDKRTRDSHGRVDGERIDNNKPFSNGLMFPGDPNGAPAEVYNCRCTITAIIPETEQKTRQTYEEWAAGRQIIAKSKTIKEDNAKGPAREIIDSKDMMDAFERRAEYQFDIEDVLNAQGFDGLPQLVDEEEFDKYVKESGFIAQRNYGADSQELLDEYKEQLYNGKWYVDCSEGGAQYGQGMYCAADYEGKLTDGIVAEMNHYRELGEEKAKEKAYNSLLDNITTKDFEQAVTAEQLQSVIKKEKGELLTFKDRQVYDTIDKGTLKKIEGKMYDLADEVDTSVKWYDYTETLTLDKSAKILSFEGDDPSEIYNIVAKEYISKRIDGNAKKVYTEWIEYDEKKKEILKRVSIEKDYVKREKLYKDADDIYEKIDNIRSGDVWKSEIEPYNRKFYDKVGKLNEGSIAALAGYDAINAKGHGDSGSYTIILNRTKLIIKRGEK